MPEENKPCQYHTKLFADVEVIKTTITNLDKRINGALDIAQKHIEDGSKWRFAIVGVAVTLIVNIFIAIFWFGKVAQRLDTHAYAIEKLEELHPRIK